jgi:ABC-type transport system involved in multi-copper enzyme maturation permease subunit
VSLRRVWLVARLDLAHNTRRFFFWFWMVIIGFMTWSLSSGNARMSSGDASVGGTEAWLTSEFSVGMQLSMLVLMIYAFFIAIAAGMLIVRDAEMGVGELLHSTPLRAGEYVWGRFLAVTASFLVILALHVACMIVIYHGLDRPSMDDMRGPLHLANYVRPALVFGVPTIVFFAGTSFAIGTLTRKPIVVFFLPVAFIVVCGFFLWNWAPSWLDPRINRVLMFLDPGGFRWLNETWLKVDRGVDFYNEASIGLDGLFVANRLVLIALGLGAVVLAQWRFARQLRGAKHGAARPAGAADQPDETATTSPADALVPISSVRAAARPPGLARGTLAVARFELRELRHHPGLYLFVPLILIQTVATMFFAVGAFGTPLLQTPGTLAVGTMNTLTLLVCLLIQFYTVESVQRDRNTGAAAMIYATPVPSAALLLGKAVANVAIGGAILLATFVGSIIVLASQGEVALSLGPFLIVWGLVLVPTFLVWSAFVMAAAALLRNRYVTHALCLGVLILTGYKQLSGEMNWAGNWDAWGVIQWSDMGTLELNRLPLVLNRIMVIFLTALFVALAVRIYSRRDFDAARIIHRLRPRALLIYGLRLLPFVVVPVVLGGYLYSAVADGFQGERATESAKDYWRENLATWRDAPSPAIACADIDLELDPARRWFRTNGRFEIYNPHEEPLAQIPLTGGRHWENLEWTLDGEAYEPEDRSRLYVFTPPAPLGPDDRIEIGFRFEGTYPKGFTENGGGAGQFILPSGVVLTSFTTSFVPVVGYSEGIGVDEDNQYEPKKYPDDFYEGVTDPAMGNGWPYATRVRITGPAEYTYNSIGVLVSEDVEDDVRTVVWESDHPVTFFNVVAGRWDVHRGENTAIYYHPGHAYNIEEMSQALDAARRYYSEWFHPYPWQELKLSEFPALATYAQGFATNITFSEGIGFLTRSEPRTNLAFWVTAHEAAHQWWGNILMPGEGPGGGILSEGMAHFSSILLLEQVKGLRGRIEFCRRIEENYGEERYVDSERPLVWTDGSKPGDRDVVYDKGGWVFWMLLNHMGREPCLAGIQQFIAHYSTDPDHPVLQDFVASMRPFAPDPEAFDAFVEAWFFEVVVPEYRLSDAEVVPVDGADQDAWRVTAMIANDGTGSFPVEVAAARGERFNDDGSPSPDYRESRVTVTVGPDEQVDLEIPCGFEPDRVVVDPDALILQLDRDDAIARF